LLTHDRVDFDQLKATAEVARSGRALPPLLVIARQHGLRYGSRSVDLPEMVKSAAQFNARHTYLGQSFVRVPSCRKEPISSCVNS